MTTEFKWRFHFSDLKGEAHAFPRKGNSFNSLCGSHNLITSGPWCISKEENSNCLACTIVALTKKDEVDGQTDP